MTRLTPGASFIGEQLAQRAAKANSQAAAARVAPTEAAIHDLRVSIRRLLEALRIFREEVKPRPARQLRKRLRRVMKAAGRARNLDITANLAERAGGSASPATVVSLRNARREAAERLVRELLKLPEITPPPVLHAATGPELAAARLPRLVGRYWKAGRDAAAAPAESWDLLHRFRLATKHLRYTIELFASCYGRPGVRARLDALRALQGRLGRINDCESALGLRRVAEDTAFRDWLRQRQQAECEAFLKAWDQEFAAPASTARWRRYFERPTSPPEPHLLK